MVTLGARMGNPTEPMTQGLLFLLSSIEPVTGLYLWYFTLICYYVIINQIKVCYRRKIKMDAPKKDKKNQSKFKKYFRWPLIVLVLSFCLSMTFGVLSEVALNGANIAIAIVVIIVFLFVAILTDMIGVAITACDVKNYRAMAAKKVRGAKEAIMLQKNADRVSSIVADILGDICSILSGAAGAAVATALITQSMTDFMGVVVSSLVSAVIAALLISGKAFMKRYSLEHADKIILLLGKFLSIFHFSKNQKKSKNKTNKKKNKSNNDKKSSGDNKNLNMSEVIEENNEQSEEVKTDEIKETAKTDNEKSEN